jgi:hypothetical protein
MQMMFFQNSLWLTCRYGETEHGTLDENLGDLELPPKTRYTTYAWIY